jgi:hypothetical protein
MDSDDNDFRVQGTTHCRSSKASGGGKNGYSNDLRRSHNVWPGHLYVHWLRSTAEFLNASFQNKLQKILLHHGHHGHGVCRIDPTEDGDRPPPESGALMVPGPVKWIERMYKKAVSDYYPKPGWEGAVRVVQTDSVEELYPEEDLTPQESFCAAYYSERGVNPCDWQHASVRVAQTDFQQGHGGHVAQQHINRSLPLPESKLVDVMRCTLVADGDQQAVDFYHTLLHHSQSDENFKIVAVKNQYDTKSKRKHFRALYLTLRYTHSSRSMLCEVMIQTRAVWKTKNTHMFYTLSRLKSTAEIQDVFSEVVSHNKQRNEHEVGSEMALKAPAQLGSSGRNAFRRANIDVPLLDEFDGGLYLGLLFD